MNPNQSRCILSYHEENLFKTKIMQLYALENDFPIAASKAEKGKDYLCPECRAQVRLRGGPSRQTHFYHLALPKSCRQHQKSEEHLQLQIRLVAAIGNGAQIEARFDPIQRIADVAWHAKKIVFEIQRSPISLEEVKERNLDYQSVGYEVIWILHDAQFNKRTLQAAENFLRTTPCYYTNIDKLGVGIVYDQFEVIEGNRRNFKGPPLSVAPEKIATMPQIASPDMELPQILLSRLQNWKCYAQGDLLHRIIKENNLSLSAKKMLLLESQRKNPHKPAAAPRLAVSTLIKKCYLAALDFLQHRIN